MAVTTENNFMAKPLEKEFEFFLKHQDELVANIPASS
jgi:hypothetical protein